VVAKKRTYFPFQHYTVFDLQDSREELDAAEYVLALVSGQEAHILFSFFHTAMLYLLISVLYYIA